MIQWHPAAGKVIGERQTEHDQQPDNPDRRGQMQQSAAALDVHEKQRDDQCLRNRDRQRYDQVKQTKIVVTDAPG